MIARDRRPILASESPVDRPTVTLAIANRLRLFGGGALDTKAGPITGRAVQRHRIALLALLATTKRLYRSRDQLITLLWPDTNAERGRKLLSDSIYRVNQALGGDAITGTGDDVRLNRGQLGSDVADFEAAIEARDWQRAVEVYAGPFLDGFYLPDSTGFDQWMEIERAQYARTVAKAIEALAIEARDAGRAAESADWWQRLASLVPDNSRVAMELMRALEATGNRAGALQHARLHSAVLRETFGVEPDRSVRELADQIAKLTNSAPVTTSAAPVHGSAIAVLPFSNISESETNSYFADGVSEELMYLLTRTPGLRVASRTSSFAYRDLKLDVRELARRLDVDWILEGSVRRSGDTLRIAAQLTDARNGFQIWSEAFDRSSCDIFAIQAEIAGTIANHIAPAVAGSVGPASLFAARGASDPNTYDLYFQARFHWHSRTRESLRTAAELFEQVVAREPENARAWAGLADTYAVTAFYDYVAPRLAFPRADSAARRANELDPSLAGPYATLAYVDTYYHWNWESAEHGFRRAIEIEPTNSTAHQWYGSFLSARGRFEEAEREMRRAAELDPLSMIAHSGIGWILALANENDRAIRQLQSALQLNANFCLAHFWMGLALEQKGEPAQAIPFLRRAMELSPDSSLGLGALAHAQVAVGDAASARAILDDLLDREKTGVYISSYQLAKVYHAMGEVPAALARLERAYADRAHAMAYLNVDPQLRPLASHPRFKRLVEQVEQFGTPRRPMAHQA